PGEDFAEALYAEVEARISRDGPAKVADVLRGLPRRGSDEEDPTWRAYDLYGDPDTVLFRD
ncbi:MAG: hypothetical protein AAFU79_35275, partial [Myxococcota bacterium]